MAKTIEDDDDPKLALYDNNFEFENINASILNLNINKPTLNKKENGKRRKKL